MRHDWHRAKGGGVAICLRCRRSIVLSDKDAVKARDTTPCEDDGRTVAPLDESHFDLIAGYPQVGGSDVVGSPR